jgi:hypothetical protein
MRITRRPSFQQQQQQQQQQQAAAGSKQQQQRRGQPQQGTRRRAAAASTLPILGGCPPHKAISSTPNASNAASSIQFNKPLNQRLRLLPPLKSHRTRSL